MANHSGENSKVKNIHDLLINIRANKYAAIVEKSGCSSCKPLEKHGIVLQRKHSRSPTSQLYVNLKVGLVPMHPSTNLHRRVGPRKHVKIHTCIGTSPTRMAVVRKKEVGTLCWDWFYGSSYCT